MPRASYSNLVGRPVGSKNKKPADRKSPAHVIAVKSFLSAVAQGSGRTRFELIEHCGLNTTTCQRYIVAMTTGQDKFIYVDRYIRWNLRGQWSAVYKFGYNQPNAPKPIWLTKRQKQQLLCNWIEVITDKGTYCEYTGIEIPRYKLSELCRDERSHAGIKPRDD